MFLTIVGQNLVYIFLKCKSFSFRNLVFYLDFSYICSFKNILRDELILNRKQKKQQGL